MFQMTDSRPMGICYWNNTFYELPGVLQTSKPNKKPQSSLPNYIKLIITPVWYKLFVVQFIKMQYCVHANFLHFGKVTTHWDILPIPLYAGDNCKIMAVALLLKKGSEYQQGCLQWKKQHSTAKDSLGRAIFISYKLGNVIL